jgi:hypothetical protein
MAAHIHLEIQSISPSLKENSKQHLNKYRPSEKNSGVLVLNIYSLLWHNNFLLTKTIRQSLKHLLPFSAIQCEHH